MPAEKRPLIEWGDEPLRKPLKATAIIDINKLPEDGAVMRTLQELTADDMPSRNKAETEAAIRDGTISTRELLEKLLHWEGIIGYSDVIMTWFEEFQTARK